MKVDSHDSFVEMSRELKKRNFMSPFCDGSYVEIVTLFSLLDLQYEEKSFYGLLWSQKTSIGS